MIKFRAKMKWFLPRRHCNVNGVFTLRVYMSWSFRKALQDGKYTRLRDHLSEWQWPMAGNWDCLTDRPSRINWAQISRSGPSWTPWLFQDAKDYLDNPRQIRPGWPADVGIHGRWLGTTTRLALSDTKLQLARLPWATCTRAVQN